MSASCKRGSNCSLARAMDGCIVHCGIISSCQAAVTCKALQVASLTHVRSAIASTRPLPLLLLQRLLYLWVVQVMSKLSKSWQQLIKYSVRQPRWQSTTVNIVLHRHTQCQQLQLQLLLLQLQHTQKLIKYSVRQPRRQSTTVNTVLHRHTHSVNNYYYYYYNYYNYYYNNYNNYNTDRSWSSTV